jgi:site-specific recombinase XerD
MSNAEAEQPAVPTSGHHSPSNDGPSSLPAISQESNAVFISPPTHPPELTTARERLAWEDFIVGVGPGTRVVYARAVGRFTRHLESLGLSVSSATPRHVAIYIESLAARPGYRQRTAQHAMAIRTRKQHLAAIRHFYHHLVQRHAALLNPAASVRSPRLVVDRGETVAIRPEHIRQTLAAINTSTLIGQRDHAIIKVLSLTAARVGAVAKLTRGSVRLDMSSPWPRDEVLILEEKNAKRRQLPLAGELRQVLHRWLERIGPGEVDSPLFASLTPHRRQSRQLTGQDILRIVRRRLASAGLASAELSCHSFRAGAATALLESGLELSRVQDLLGHADPRTTRMYDARSRQVQGETMDRLNRLFRGA